MSYLRTLTFAFPVPLVRKSFAHRLLTDFVMEFHLPKSGEKDSLTGTVVITSKEDAKEETETTNEIAFLDFLSYYFPPKKSQKSKKQIECDSPPLFHLFAQYCEDASADGGMLATFDKSGPMGFVFLFVLLCCFFPKLVKFQFEFRGRKALALIGKKMQPHKEETEEKEEKEAENLQESLGEESAVLPLNPESVFADFKSIIESGDGISTWQCFVSTLPNSLQGRVFVEFALRGWIIARAEGGEEGGEEENFADGENGENGKKLSKSKRRKVINPSTSAPPNPNRNLKKLPLTDAYSGFELNCPKILADFDAAVHCGRELSKWDPVNKDRVTILQTYVDGNACIRYFKDSLQDCQQINKPKSGFGKNEKRIFNVFAKEEKIFLEKCLKERLEFDKILGNLGHDTGNTGNDKVDNQESLVQKSVQKSSQKSCKKRRHSGKESGKAAKLKIGNQEWAKAVRERTKTEKLAIGNQKWAKALRTRTRTKSVARNQKRKHSGAQASTTKGKKLCQSPPSTSPPPNTVSASDLVDSALVECSTQATQATENTQIPETTQTTQTTEVEVSFRLHWGNIRTKVPQSSWIPQIRRLHPHLEGILQLLDNSRILGTGLDEWCAQNAKVYETFLKNWVGWCFVFLLLLSKIFASFEKINKAVFEQECWSKTHCLDLLEMERKEIGGMEMEEKEQEQMKRGWTKEWQNLVVGLTGIIYFLLQNCGWINLFMQENEKQSTTKPFQLHPQDLEKCLPPKKYKGFCDTLHSLTIYLEMGEGQCEKDDKKNQEASHFACLSILWDGICPQNQFTRVEKECQNARLTTHLRGFLAFELWYFLFINCHHANLQFGFLASWKVLNVQDFQNLAFLLKHLLQLALCSPSSSPSIKSILGKIEILKHKEESVFQWEANVVPKSKYVSKDFEGLSQATELFGSFSSPMLYLLELLGSRFGFNEAFLNNHQMARNLVQQKFQDFATRFENWFQARAKPLVISISKFQSQLHEKTFGEEEKRLHWENQMLLRMLKDMAWKWKKVSVSVISATTATTATATGTNQLSWSQKIRAILNIQAKWLVYFQLSKSSLNQGNFAESAWKNLTLLAAMEDNDPDLATWAFYPFPPAPSASASPSTQGLSSSDAKETKETMLRCEKARKLVCEYYTHVLFFHFKIWELNAGEKKLRIAELVSPELGGMELKEIIYPLLGLSDAHLNDLLQHVFDRVLELEETKLERKVKEEKKKEGKILDPEDFPKLQRRVVTDDEGMGYLYLTLWRNPMFDQNANEDWKRVLKKLAGSRNEGIRQKKIVREMTGLTLT